MKDKVMWIDAVCIDQTNLLERNHQVGMMGDVYRNAMQVRAWLGLERHDSAEAYRWMRQRKGTNLMVHNIRYPAKNYLMRKNPALHPYLQWYHLQTGRTGAEH